jgi:hypothetical protein
LAVSTTLRARPAVKRAATVHFMYGGGAAGDDIGIEHRLDVRFTPKSGHVQCN